MGRTGEGQVQTLVKTFEDHKHTPPRDQGTVTLAQPCSSHRSALADSDDEQGGEAETTVLHEQDAMSGKRAEVDAPGPDCIRDRREVVFPSHNPSEDNTAEQEEISSGAAMRAPSDSPRQCSDPDSQARDGHELVDVECCCPEEECQRYGADIEFAGRITAAQHARQTHEFPASSASAQVAFEAPQAHQSNSMCHDDRRCEAHVYPPTPSAPDPVDRLSKNRGTQATLGLMWEIFPERPAQGRELSDSGLASALECKTIFTQREWEAFGISDLRDDDFIKSGDFYFKPAESRIRLPWKVACGHVCVAWLLCLGECIG